MSFAPMRECRLAQIAIRTAGVACVLSDFTTIFAVSLHKQNGCPPLYDGMGKRGPDKGDREPAFPADRGEERDQQMKRHELRTEREEND